MYFCYSWISATLEKTSDRSDVRHQPNETQTTSDQGFTTDRDPQPRPPLPTDLLMSPHTIEPESLSRVLNEFVFGEAFLSRALTAKSTRCIRYVFLPATR